MDRDLAVPIIPLHRAPKHFGEIRYAADDRAGAVSLTDNLVQRMFAISRKRPHLGWPTPRLDGLREGRARQDVRTFELDHARITRHTLRLDRLGLAANRDAQRVDLEARRRNHAGHSR